MNARISILLIGLAVVSVALAPSLTISQSADAQSTTSSDPHWCRNQKDKSGDWIFGCQNGWWDHNHCQDFRPESGHYARGYIVGWERGHCR